ncbi:MAG: trehalose-phosphatase [Pseudomonadota bacterium]
MTDSHLHMPAPEPCNFQTRRTCLFLDVDGTLADLQPLPTDVRIDDELIVLLSRVHSHLGGALAIISGRPLADLDRMFAPLNIPMAGIHGFERRCAQGNVHRPTVPRARLDAARDRLEKLAQVHPGLLIEDKGAALAVHFRGAPGAAEIAADAMRQCIRGLESEFELLEGNCVIEIKPAAQNKATAIEAYMKEDPFAGLTPIYIGDDRTDCDGFGAVRRHGGVDISVGELVLARWHLEHPKAVRAWLRCFADAESRGKCTR